MQFSSGLGLSGTEEQPHPFHFHFLSLQPIIQPNLKYTLPPEAYTELAKTKQGDPGNLLEELFHFF